MTTGAGSAHETMPDLRRVKSCLNIFHSVKFFVACQSFLQLVLLMTSGYVKGSISTIEKRFGFSSQTSGLVASFNEVGNMLLIVFVSYFGRRVHRPRVIGCGAVLISIASFIISLPQFVLGMYEFDHYSEESNVTNICLPGPRPVSEPEKCTAQKAQESQMALFLLLLGQALLGIGAVPIQPFGISYIDDFASKSNSPLYVGIIFAVTTLGPALAFGIMHEMLEIYIDVDKVPEEDILLTPEDPRWVGAWWLGFVFTSAVAALAAIPYFFFPRELQKEEDSLKGFEGPKESNVQGELENLTLLESIKRFPVVVMRNFKNPFFVIVISAMVSLSAMVTGFATFLGKFLEWQFSLTASYANMLIGAVSLPVATLGILLGGLIMKKFHLSRKHSSLLCITGMGFCILFRFPQFLLGCHTHAVAGLNNTGSSAFGGGHLPDCSQICNCPPSAFSPVCGQDRIEYISPCHAGCSSVHYYAASKKVLNYTRCRCIIFKGAAGYAVPGMCGSKCSRLLAPFVAFISLVGFMASIIQIPALMVLLRSIKAEDKSFAIGTQYFMIRAVAWLPAPVIYGSIIDSTCLLWQHKCQKKAACRYYNSTTLRHRFFGLQVVFEGISFSCFVALYHFSRKAERSKPETREENHREEVPKPEPGEENHREEVPKEMLEIPEVPEEDS